jgi:16S rRNA G527 N7-methylase RsmG
VAHARGFACALPEGAGADQLACDLGSGGGLPGLVLAVDVWPTSRWVLLEGMAKRAQLLQWAVDHLGIEDRVVVEHGRAEHLSRVGEALRGACRLVTARSFGSPPTVAEAAAPLLGEGGMLVVSEPPGSEGERWPAEGVARVGLVPEGMLRTERAGYMVLRQATPCPEAYPRAWKRQSRQPLF